MAKYPSHPERNNGPQNSSCNFFAFRLCDVPSLHHKSKHPTGKKIRPEDICRDEKRGDEGYHLREFSLQILLRDLYWTEPSWHDAIASAGNFGSKNIPVLFEVLDDLASYRIHIRMDTAFDEV